MNDRLEYHCCSFVAANGQFFAHRAEACVLQRVRVTVVVKLKRRERKDAETTEPNIERAEEAIHRGGKRITSKRQSR